MTHPSSVKQVRKDHRRISGPTGHCATTPCECDSLISCSSSKYAYSRNWLNVMRITVVRTQDGNGIGAVLINNLMRLHNVKA